MKVTESERLRLAAVILAGLQANSTVDMEKQDGAQWSLDQVDALILFAGGEVVDDD